MKLFIIGSTGVLGKRVVKSLIQNNEIYCLVRSESKKKIIEDLGGKAYVGNIYDEKFLLDVTNNIDGILHLATSIPHKSKLKAKDMNENSLLRTEAVKVLINVVKKNKIKFLIHNSILYSYGNRKGEWVDESIKFDKPISTYFSMSDKDRYAYESAIIGEDILNTEILSGFPAIILRFGMFYSADSRNTIEILEAVRKGKMPIIGDGKAYLNFIHVDDAAQAVVKATMNYEQLIGKTFNVSDDDPATVNDVFSYLANIIGAKKPKHIPVLIANLFAGKIMTYLFLSSFRNRNDLLKKETGWKPKYPNFKDGFRQTLEELSYIKN